MKWLRKLLDVSCDTRSDLDTFLKHQERSELRYHQRISELIATLDKIVTARYDRPTIAPVEPNRIQAPIPQHALSDVLTDDDDSSFIAKAEEFLS